MIFDIGDKAYIVENHSNVREVTVARRTGDMYLVKFGMGSGIQVRHTRLFATKGEAEKTIIPLGKPEEKKRTGYRSPYDF